MFNYVREGWETGVWPSESLGRRRRIRREAGTGTCRKESGTGLVEYLV